MESGQVDDVSAGLGRRAVNPGWPTRSSNTVSLQTSLLRVSGDKMAWLNAALGRGLRGLAIDRNAEMTKRYQTLARSSRLFM